MGRADRRREEIVEHEVAVRDGVDRVRARAVEAELRRRRVTVELPVEPREGTGAERHLPCGPSGRLEPAPVALEHPEVGEQVVAEVDRLGALQVRVAGHRPVAMRLGERSSPPAARSSSGCAPGAVGARRAQVGRHLVVSRAARCAACRRAARSARSAAARPPCGCPRRCRGSAASPRSTRRRPRRGRLGSVPTLPRRSPRHVQALRRGPSRRGSPAATAACRSRSKC